MSNEIDRESLEYLLAYPEMPPGFPAPEPVKQEPETEAANIPIEREPGTEDQEVKIEGQDIKPEEQEIKQEIKKEVGVLAHLINTYRAYGTTPDEDGYNLTCRFCNFSCSNMLELKAHWPVHVGVETTKCIVCNMRCSNLELAKKHVTHGRHLNRMRVLGIGGEEPARRA
ncbi:unnamed protein product [Aureobasidium mustum]|uniref:C2H2-type domain-containing protein n=1 Tax=Aureobasidium mustum TaxID=2773714 RepID=A0A9N8JZN1_9PEZI|nr:unnamed protein product [Aureobasidium mustum]